LGELFASALPADGADIYALGCGAGWEISRGFQEAWLSLVAQRFLDMAIYPDTVCGRTLTQIAPWFREEPPGSAWLGTCFVVVACAALNIAGIRVGGNHFAFGSFSLLSMPFALISTAFPFQASAVAKWRRGGAAVAVKVWGTVGLLGRNADRDVELHGGGTNASTIRAGSGAAAKDLSEKR